MHGEQWVQPEPGPVKPPDWHCRKPSCPTLSQADQDTENQDGEDQDDGAGEPVSHGRLRLRVDAKSEEPPIGLFIKGI